MSLTRRCISDPEALDALQSQWDDLLRSSATGSPFCSYGWCVTWWRTFGAGWRPSVYVWERAGQLVALLPLMHRRRFGWLREIRFMAGREVAPEQLDALVLASDRGEIGSQLALLFEELRRRSDVLRFHDLAPDGLLAGVLGSDRTESPSNAIVMPSPPQAGVVIDGAFDSYFSARGAKVRRNFRYSCRAFEAELGATPKVHRPQSPNDAVACFDALWALHESSFRRRDEFDFFRSTQVQAFHRAVLSSPGLLDLVRFITLGSARQVFASLYCIVHRRRMYCYQIGFESAVEKLSPGFVAIGAAIRTAFEERCTYFDFLRGEEQYKQRWANASHHTVDCTQSMDTIAAGVWYAAAGCAGGMRKIKRALVRTAQQPYLVSFPAARVERTDSKRGASHAARVRLPIAE